MCFSLHTPSRPGGKGQSGGRARRSRPTTMYDAVRAVKFVLVALAGTSAAQNSTTYATPAAMPAARDYLCTKCLGRPIRASPLPPTARLPRAAGARARTRTRRAWRRDVVSLRVVQCTCKNKPPWRIMRWATGPWSVQVVTEKRRLSLHGKRAIDPWRICSVIVRLRLIVACSGCTSCYVTDVPCSDACMRSYIACANRGRSNITASTIRIGTRDGWVR
jgi:hypothetical protein